MISDFEQSKFYVISLDLSDLRVLKVSPDIEWAMLVAFNRVFFASPFWRKLQNIFGGCCSSKMEEVAATHYGHDRGAGHPQGHHVRSLYYQPKFPSRKLFSVSSPQRQDEGIPALSR